MIRNILEYLEYDAANYGEKSALADENRSYTYAQWLDFSRRIGSALGRRSAMNRPIGVYMDKNADDLLAFMGIVQAGCFYVLFNTDFPESRLNQIQSVLQTEYIIVDEEHREMAEKLLDGKKDHVLLLSDLMKEEEDAVLLKTIRDRAIDTDPLYANFTSGSTGVPKGVVVGHRSVLDFIELFVPMFGIDETDIIANQAPFDFDVSVKDIYSALKAAATLVVVPRRFFSKPVDLLDFLCEKKITTMVWAVSALCLITTFHGLDYKTPDTVKRVLFSGEVMPYKHLKTWMEKLPDAEFVNLYGPTEITCNCTYHRISRDRDYSEKIPIGRAFPNEHVFLLDENDKEVTEPGKTGEICVRGSALALGYFRNPAQTEAAFVVNPLNPCYPERIYRTGDLGQYAEDGEMLFCGRKDFQIKYMGHRIEIEEIERAISDVNGVERCCVIFEEAKQRLYGFYVGSIDKKDLHTVLSERLPIYMIPGTLKSIESFPLTKNGKIDRKLLLEKKNQK
ncbi:MAG: amino acid adenylation domain-containing protein [Clostridiales bacterium]|nr:amino acid adenylation domain-containing protein [Clostridiales bacterium]